LSRWFSPGSFAGGAARHGASGHDTTVGIEHHVSRHAVGERVELARYEVAAGERVVYGQRVEGVVRVTDVPAEGRGRAHLVERGLEEDGYEALKALVSDYVGQSQVLNPVPMSVMPLGEIGVEEDER
jgi:hypothetical protein